MLTANSLFLGAIGKSISLACKSPALSAGAADSDLGPDSSYCSRSITVAMDAAKVSVSSAAGGNENGVFVNDVPHKVSLGALGPTQIAVSDQFSGCDFTILQKPDGTILASHVYSDDTCRNKVSEDGLPAGWKHLATWKSKGWAAHWQCSGLVCFAFIGAAEVKFVFLGITGPWDAPTVGHANIESHAFS